VTFFGHKNCPHSVQNDIENTIRDLIENAYIDIVDEGEDKA
jgi:hypothetical protein